MNFTELEKALDGLEGKIDDGVDAASGKIGITELLAPEFIRAHSQYSSFEELLTGGGFSLGSEADERFKSHVANAMGFDSWGSLLSEAAKEHVIRNLDL